MKIFKNIKQFKIIVVFALFTLFITPIFSQTQNIIDTNQIVLSEFCLGSITGSIEISLLLGQDPVFFGFEWTNINNPLTILDTDTLISNLLPGTYIITVTDLSSPTSIDQDTIIIQEPQDPMTVVTEVNQNVICHGDSTGSATVAVIGGIIPYTYLWPTGETTTFATNLWAGIHNVIVTDANGCSVMESVLITNTYNPFSISLDTLQQVQCHGEYNGEVALSIYAGGVSPYTFEWSTGQTYTGPGLDTAFNLGQGGHQVIIFDTYGCDTTISFTIIEPPILYAQANSIQPVQCFGFDDGMAHTFGFGGTGVGTYIYSWSPISNTNDTTTNLPPGIYTASVIDTNGCIASDTVVITEPAQLVVDIIDSLAIYSYCLGTNSGALCAVASAGTAPYTYAWDNTFQQTSCITNLHAGIYTVSVIDARSCVASDIFDLDSITNTFIPDSVNLTISDVSCDGLYDGEININNISGAIGPFQYDWTGPGTYTGIGNIINGLYAGNYAVVIEDSSGCKMTLDADVLSPDKLEYSIDYVIDESCIGSNGSSCNGQIVLNITGGNSPYYYDNTFTGGFPILPADTQLVIQDTLITGFCNGAYAIYLTDINGCQGYEYIGGDFIANVNSETQVYINSVNTINSLCFNTSEGYAWPAGGADPLLNYTWETNNSGTPSGIVIASGGSYNGFFAGDYWLVAHYANAASFGQNYVGCDVAFPFTINTSNTISISPLITNVTCSGDEDGAIDLNPIGTLPFSFLWDTLTAIPYINITNEDQLSLAAGTYTVSITDAAGCILIEAIDVWEPTPIITNFVNLNNVSCNGLSDGSVTALVDPNSGAGSFTYSWAPGGQIGSNASVLSGGIYTVTVIDSNGLGCSANFNVTIVEPSPVIALAEANSFYGEDDFGNPYHIRCFGESNGSLIVSNSGGTGTVVYAWKNDLGITVSTSQNTGTILPEGDYTLTATDANGCLEDTTITLNEPDLILPNIETSYYSTSLSSITHEISCYGLYDGWAVSHPIGGYPGSQGYSFIWINNNNQIMELVDSAVDLSALYSYTVTVTDMNGCSQSATTSMFDQPNPFVADVTTTNYAGATHAPFTVNFIDNTISTDPFDFNWTWEDSEEYFPIGTTSMDHKFTIDNIGLNQVYVVLTNLTTGCMDTVFFTIDAQGILDINNVFTPNSDGINDEYSFGEYAMEEVVVNIWNRWGQLVYVWEGVDKAWRGVSTNGENVPEGVYFYVLQSDGEDGRYYEKKGSITLLR